MVVLVSEEDGLPHTPTDVAIRSLAGQRESYEAEYASSVPKLRGLHSACERSFTQLKQEKATLGDSEDELRRIVQEARPRTPAPAHPYPRASLARRIRGAASHRGGGALTLTLPEP